MGTIAQMPERTQPETPVGGEAFARSLWEAQLKQSEAMTIIANTLNSLEMVRDGLPLCRLADREFKDFLRISRKAKAIVRSVQEDVTDYAVEEVAIVLCEGAEGEYSKFDDQAPEVKTRYRRWAQTCINAEWTALEGRERTDLR